MCENNIEIRKALEEKLAVIGWSLKNHGCDTYRIYNNNNECTAFEYWSGEIRLEDKQEVFGHSFGGTLCLILKNCNIEVMDTAGRNAFVSIKSKKEKDKVTSIFLSFYKRETKEQRDE